MNDTSEPLTLRSKPSTAARVLLLLLGAWIVARLISLLWGEWGKPVGSVAFMAFVLAVQGLMMLVGLHLILLAVVGPGMVWTVDRRGITVDRRTAFGRHRHIVVPADQARSAYVLQSTVPVPHSVTFRHAIVVPAPGDGRRPYVAFPCSGGIVAAEETLSRIRLALGETRAFRESGAER